MGDVGPWVAFHLYVMVMYSRQVTEVGVPHDDDPTLRVEVPVGVFGALVIVAAEEGVLGWVGWIQDAGERGVRRGWRRSWGMSLVVGCCVTGVGTGLSGGWWQWEGYRNG